MALFAIFEYVKKLKTFGKQIQFLGDEFIILISNIHLCLMCEVFSCHVVPQLFV